jgi:TolB-like protein
MVEGGGEDKASVRAPAVFISYASQDAEAAKRICDALRAAGIEVWFDQSELRGGDVWDRQIRQQIHDCRLFMPIVSANTETRVEGYFRREWKLAVDRTHDLSERVAFLVPIVVDSTPEAKADVPDAFRRVQWTRLPDGSASPAFVERIRRLIMPAPAPALPGAVMPPEYRTAQSSTTTNGPQRVARVALWATSGVVALGFAYFVADRFWFSKRGTDVHSVAKLPDNSASNAGSPAVIASTFNPPPHSIAVLPFTNLSGDPKQEYFSDGISEELINALSHIDALQVIARTSSFSFKGQNADIGTIARKLNVAAILEGSIRRSGNTIRITAQLINAVNGFHMWSQSYDRDLKNILALQTEIATAVAEQLRVRLVGNEAAKIEVGGTQNPKAYDAFLRGMQLAEAADGEAGYRAALAAFDEAIALDPNYAAAYGRRAVALMDTRWSSDDATIREDLRNQARTAAERAVLLAPERVDVHTALWYVRAQGYFDFRGAAAELERALILAPGSLRAQQALALQSSWLGHNDLAIEAQRQAIRLDPQNYEARTVLAGVLIFARRFDEALVAAQEAKAINPEAKNLRGFFATSYIGLGQWGLARRTCEQPPVSHGCLALVYHGLGNLKAADRELEQSKALGSDADAYRYAELYAQLGDTAKALQCLSTAERLHDPALLNLKVSWMLDPIRNEPQFKALEKRMNFPP